MEFLSREVDENWIFGNLQQKCCNCCRGVKDRFLKMTRTLVWWGYSQRLKYSQLSLKWLRKGGQTVFFFIILEQNFSIIHVHILFEQSGEAPNLLNKFIDRSIKFSPCSSSTHARYIMRGWVFAWLRDSWELNNKSIQNNKLVYFYNIYKTFDSFRIIEFFSCWKIVI